MPYFDGWFFSLRYQKKLNSWTLVSGPENFSSKVSWPRKTSSKWVRTSLRNMMDLYKKNLASALSINHLFLKWKEPCKTSSRILEVRSNDRNPEAVKPCWLPKFLIGLNSWFWTHRAWKNCKSQFWREILRECNGHSSEAQIYICTKLLSI